MIIILIILIVIIIIILIVIINVVTMIIMKCCKNLLIVHDFIFESRAYPILQEQLYEPFKFVHNWEQSLFKLIHSSISI